MARSKLALIMFAPFLLLGFVLWLAPPPSARGWQGVVGWFMLFCGGALAAIAVWMVSRARTRKAKVAAIIAATCTTAFGALYLFGPPSEGFVASPAEAVLLLVSVASSSLAARWERRAESAAR